MPTLTATTLYPVSKEGVLTLSTVAASTAKVGDQIGTITVPVVTTNYQKFEFTIKVVISARIPQCIGRHRQRVGYHLRPDAERK